MPSKANDFDQVLRENSVQGRTTTTLNHWGIFVGSGLLMVVMPLYIYASPMFDLSLREHTSQAALVSLSSSLLLAWAYRSVSLQRRIALLTTYQNPVNKTIEKVPKKERVSPRAYGSSPPHTAAAQEEAQATLEKTVADLCCAYALMSINIGFLVLWFALAFYSLPKVSTDISPSFNHLIAVTGPSLLFALKGTAAF